MFLQPWVGKNYHQGINSEKIIFFGESHYNEDPFDNTQESTNYTPEVVKDILQTKKHIKFFNRSGKLFNDDWTAIWDNIAFANLIQYVFLEKGDQPNAEQIATITSFYHYLEMLKPDKAIICSNRMWTQWFSKHIDDADGVELIQDAKIGISSVFKHPHSTGHTLTIGINHASSRVGDYVERWKPSVTEFLNFKV